VITAGTTTCPGPPAPEATPHPTREEPGSHYADGADLVDLPLAAVADLPTTVIRPTGRGRRGIGAGDIEPVRDGTGADPAGAAVLLHTGWDRHRGTEAHEGPAPFPEEGGAALLAGTGASLVGIGSVDIDDACGSGLRPAHPILLDARAPRWSTSPAWGTCRTRARACTRLRRGCAPWGPFRSGTYAVLPE